MKSNISLRLTLEDGTLPNNTNHLLKLKSPYQNLKPIKMPSTFQLVKFTTFSYFLISINILLILGFIAFTILMIINGRKEKNIAKSINLSGALSSESSSQSSSVLSSKKSSKKSSKSSSRSSSRSVSQSISSNISRSIQKIGKLGFGKKVAKEVTDPNQLKFYRNLEEKYNLPDEVVQDIDHKLRNGDF
uniref:Uncharacterized protein n=1 Tax=Strongyloides venezuelensis TaxID=75913 RepID=A0A0K0G048_STRVS